MIQLQAGQTFKIDDELIANFPWYDLDTVTYFTIDWQEDHYLIVRMILDCVSEPELCVLFTLEQVTECKLPEVGLRLLQFSHFIVENVRSHQWENVWFKVYDPDFGEPSFLFKSGKILIQESKQKIGNYWE
ncbi:hypothetical protein Pan241w_48800 [Gimesia alba]|uniref:Uncharacterized protein n=1 Tax=Gimesia alba TaxID=2527973 RepID=A0A517RLL5_9PLAN|nr:hypothetical protein [Gimesia alba]QDT44764.1 hypothetical protein Pan241w_48800 [Gimesia alba]